MFITITQNHSEKVAFVWADKRRLVYLPKSLSPARLAELIQNGFDDYAESDLNALELSSLREEYCQDGARLIDISVFEDGQWTFECCDKRFAEKFIECLSNFLLEC